MPTDTSLAVRLLVSMLVVLAAAAATGCASSDDPTTGAKATSTPAATASPGAEKSAPSLSLEGVERGSPEATVLTLYYYAQWGNYPGIVRLYDPRVRKAIGSSTIATVYSLNREALLALKPKVKDVRKTRDGTFVAVELTRPGLPPVYDSFLLQKATVGWGIGYDTFFDRAFGEYSRVTVDGPLREKPSEAGLAARRDASVQFRNLFLPKS